MVSSPWQLVASGQNHSGMWITLFMVITPLPMFFSVLFYSCFNSAEGILEISFGKMWKCETMVFKKGLSKELICNPVLEIWTSDGHLELFGQRPVVGQNQSSEAKFVSSGKWQWLGCTIVLNTTSMWELPPNFCAVNCATTLLTVKHTERWHFTVMPTVVSYLTVSYWELRLCRWMTVSGL